MTDIVPYDTFSIVPQAVALAEKIARTEFAPVGLRGRPEAVMAAMLTGHEVGIGPMMALSKINVIEGKPAMAAELMRALVLRAGHEIWYEEKSNTKVTVCGKRTNSDNVSRITWTMDDAKRAGIDGRQNWRKYPRAMLTARATAELSRDLFPDVLGGISYVPEEIADGDLFDNTPPDEPIVATIEPADDVSLRRAKVAPAKKRGPNKRPPPPSAPIAAVAVELPPLPGEDGYDDDGEPVPAPSPTMPTGTPAAVENNTFQRAIEQSGITGARALRTARAIAATAGNTPPGAIDEIDNNLAALVLAELNITVTSEAERGDKRNAKMWALVAEAWPNDPDEDELRRRLISVVSAGRTESSKELSDEEWSTLFGHLEDIAVDQLELYLTANGDWRLRKPMRPASKAE